MWKLTPSLVAIVVVAALSACHDAKSPDKVQSDLASAQARATSEIEDAKQSAAKQVATAQARMNDNIVDLSNANAQASYEVAIARADGEYKISSTRCNALAGSTQKECKEQAEVLHGLAKARAKAMLEAGKAIKNARWILYDGDIDNWFTCRKKSFNAPLKRVSTALAKVTDATNAEWTVRFLKILSAKYLVLDLDPDYQWAVIGHPSRRYGWVMARSKTLPDSTYQELLHRLAEQGYDPTQFQKVPQQ